MTYPPLLLTATRCLQTVILELWPRIPVYKADVLEALTVCWCRVKEEEVSDAAAITTALKDTVGLLTAATGEEGIKADYQVLMSHDERLVDLFPTSKLGVPP